MSEWFQNTCVKMLYGSDFDNEQPWNLKDKRCAFVLFFADWCGHCQNMKPEYIKFADKAQFMHVYAVDSDTNDNLLEGINGQESPIKIQGFPTVVIYVDGKPAEEYSGDHNMQGLLKKAMEICSTKCKCEK